MDEGSEVWEARSVERVTGGCLWDEHAECENYENCCRVLVPTHLAHQCCKEDPIPLWG